MFKLTKFDPTGTEFRYLVLPNTSYMGCMDRDTLKSLMVPSKYKPEIVSGLHFGVFSDRTPITEAMLPAYMILIDTETSFDVICLADLMSPESKKIHLIVKLCGQHIMLAIPAPYTQDEIEQFIKVFDEGAMTMIGKYNEIAYVNRNFYSDDRRIVYNGKIITIKDSMTSYYMSDRVDLIPIPDDSTTTFPESFNIKDVQGYSGYITKSTLSAYMEGRRYSRDYLYPYYSVSGSVVITDIKATDLTKEVINAYEKMPDDTLLPFIFDTRLVRSTMGSFVLLVEIDETWISVTIDTPKLYKETETFLDRFGRELGLMFIACYNYQMLMDVQCGMSGSVYVPLNENDKELMRTLNVDIPVVEMEFINKVE